MTDQEIFTGIARQDNRTFQFLYQEYQGKILGMVQKNNGNAEDALDVFQEGIIGLWTNIEKGKFQLQDSAKISTYLFALCRNIWISKLRKRKVLFSIDERTQGEIAEEVDEMEEQYDRIKTLEDRFRQLGDSCQQLLKLFYYQKVALKVIAQTLSITEKTAKNNKYRCMQKLRALY